MGVAARGRRGAPIIIRGARIPQVPPRVPVVAIISVASDLAAQMARLIRYPSVRRRASYDNVLIFCLAPPKLLLRLHLKRPRSERRQG